MEITPENTLLTLIDEVVRLRGRVLIATRRSDGAPDLTGLEWLVLSAVIKAKMPPTVARIGRSFGHPRQSIQRLADELGRRGLIRFEDNPDHRRAKLLLPTEAGLQLYQEQTRQGLEWAERIGHDLEPAALAQAIETLRQLRHRIELDQKHLDK